MENNSGKETGKRSNFTKYLFFLVSLTIFVCSIHFYDNKFFTRFIKQKIENEDEDIYIANEEADKYPDDYVSNYNLTPTIKVVSDDNPEIWEVENLISDDEVEFVLEKALPRLGKASPFQDRDKAYSNKFFSGLNCFFKNGEYPLVDNIKRRISKFISEPFESIEVSRITRYGLGQYVQAHLDSYVSPQDVIEARGQRHRTVVVYLNTLTKEEGGGTHFPKRNITVQPNKRGASIFRSVNKKTKKVDSNSIHESLPVLNKEKWVMVFFIKNRADYDGDK